MPCPGSGRFEIDSKTAPFTGGIRELTRPLWFRARSTQIHRIYLGSETGGEFGSRAAVCTSICLSLVSPQS
jgi:hypothetical protein